VLGDNVLKDVAQAALVAPHRPRKDTVLTTGQCFNDLLPGGRSGHEFSRIASLRYSAITAPHAMRTRFPHPAACVLFCSVAPCLVLSQDAVLEPKDFTKTNSITIVPVEAERGNEQRGQGLEHIYWQRDGWTTIMNVNGIECRSLNLTEQGYPKGYLYFTLDPSFKSQDVTKVRIDVEYFDGFDGKEGASGCNTTPRVRTTAPAHPPGRCIRMCG
jgi:hypothetical protein